MTEAIFLSSRRKAPPGGEFLRVHLRTTLLGSRILFYEKPTGGPHSASVISSKLSI